MAKKIYPKAARTNCFASMYCEISMEEYFKVSEIFNYLSKNDYIVSEEYNYSEMNKGVIKTVVFAAMAIESFMNDYAAACLGDSEFYSNFDKLSTISKFQLIAKFILKSEINKEASYYYYLKTLFRLRDSYVHNKSAKFNMDFSSFEDASEYRKYVPIECSENICDKDEVNDDYKSALNALKAIKEIAEYFDEHDSNVMAMRILFNPLELLYGSEKEIEYKTRVFSELNIKADKYNEI